MDGFMAKQVQDNVNGESIVVLWILTIFFEKYTKTLPSKIQILCLPFFSLNLYFHSTSITVFYTDIILFQIKWLSWTTLSYFFAICIVCTFSNFKLTMSITL